MLKKIKQKQRENELKPLIHKYCIVPQGHKLYLTKVYHAPFYFGHVGHSMFLLLILLCAAIHI